MKAGSKIGAIPLPFVVQREGKYLSAWCPVLDIATQGKNDKELEKNIHELVDIYFADKDTYKPKYQTLMETTIEIKNIPITLPRGGCSDETAKTVRA